MRFQRSDNPSSWRSWLSGPFFRYVSIGAIAGLAVVAFLANPALGLAYRQATTKLPPTVTEMYFTNPNNLPQSLAVGRHASVGFHITNHMGTTFTYSYQIVEVTSSTRVIVSRGQVVLADGTGADQNAEFTVATPGPTEIMVVLSAPSEQIDLWLNQS